MQKVEKILLLVLNILIDIFLISVVVSFVLWLIWGITPEKAALWIEQTWNSLTGYTVSERSLQLSEKYQRRAHRYVYVQEPDKKEENKEGPITQPYRYE